MGMDDATLGKLVRSRKEAAARTEELEASIVCLGGWPVYRQECKTQSPMSCLTIEPLGEPRRISGGVPMDPTKVIPIPESIDNGPDWSPFAVLMSIAAVATVLLALLSFVWEFDLSASPGWQVGVYHLMLALYVSMTFVIAFYRPSWADRLRLVHVRPGSSGAGDFLGSKLGTGWPFDRDP